MKFGLTQKAKGWLPAAVLAAGLMASTSAFAGPTTDVDGVIIPIGIIPGGIGVISQFINETLVDQVGQSLTGIGNFTQIVDANNNITWTSGDNGAFVNLVFSGFTVTSLTAPTATTTGSIKFSGGTVDVYAFSGAAPNVNTGNMATDISNVQAGKLWLSLNAVAQDAAGDTLLVTLPAGSTADNFIAAGGSVFLDVTGGDAAGNLKTCTFTNAFDPNGKGCSDILFTEDSSVHVGIPNDFNNAAGAHVSGSGTANINTIPEPGALGLLGMGLVAFGFAWRRRARA